MSEYIASLLDNNKNKLFEDIECNELCKNNKKGKKLYKDYVSAKKNLSTAPEKLEKSVEKYYTYTKGKARYNTYLDNILNTNSEQTKDVIKKVFLENVSDVKQNIERYKESHITFTTLIELYHKFFKENEVLIHRISNTTSDILTNERNSYYQSQTTESTTYYNKTMVYIYITLVIICIALMFMRPNQVEIKTKAYALLFLVVSPFILFFIFSQFEKIEKK
jgi:CHASE3 domain sensor protein